MLTLAELYVDYLLSLTLTSAKYTVDILKPAEEQ